MELDYKNLLLPRSFKHLTEGKYENLSWCNSTLNCDGVIVNLLIHSTQSTSPKINIKNIGPIYEKFHKLFLNIPNESIFKFYYLNVFGQEVFIK